MLTTLKKLWQDEAAQDLAEYGIALAVITVAVAAAALAISTDVTTIWEAAKTVINNVAKALPAAPTP
ncbi:MAG: Flp family type IVb pilin [Deltaproteobacteria bacterium]|nr:MAG: Flp family type IVb pilin [Gemmatimonadota bacterium]TMA70562.1 MAG: Flp family type IVb pilin [Deltaproteobacteria bacterium]